MRNVFLFINKFRVFGVFLILEIFAIFLLINRNSYQHSLYSKTANNVSGTFYKNVNMVRSYFLLKSTNEILTEENSLLRAKLLESQYNLSSDSGEVNDTTLKQKYLYITADVIRNTTSYLNNFITLNQGERQGIKVGMGVITGAGVVGEVVSVSENFSVVKSLLNTLTKIPPKIEENDYFGSLIWDGKNPYYANLKEINIQVPVKIGQRIVTSGYSKIYPQNIPIGEISSIEKPAGANFYEIQVKLFTNFSTLQKVYVVNNLLKNEQDSIEHNIDR